MLLSKPYMQVIFPHAQVGFIPNIQGSFKIGKSIKVTLHTNKLMKENHMHFD